MVHIKPEMPTKVTMHQIFDDVVLQKQLMEQGDTAINTEWKLLFYPKGFVADKAIESLDQFRLSELKLKRLGVSAST